MCGDRGPDAGAAPAPRRRATQRRRTAQGRADRLRHLRRGRAREGDHRSGGCRGRHAVPALPAALGPGEGGGGERDRRRRRGGPGTECGVEPAEALTRWIDRFTELLGTKRGLASALHSGDPAFAGLPDYFLERLGPTLSALLDAAAAEGAIRGDIGAEDLLYAIAQLCQPVPGRGPEHGRRIVGVLVDGLRRGGGPGRPSR